MKATDRARLTAALREHVATIAADLRAKMRASGAVRALAMQLHADEQVAEDFDVWTDLLSRRAAVLWVLKSVYVRVLEDRGLLNPGRLLDPEAQQLFERLAPNLGETAFLRWVWRDLASKAGGLPELFGVQPAEVALPSDELSRGLIEFWRHRDADTGSHWSFAEERFEGELMGDLYQDLDPVVKDRFALCQTPDFVRSFILDRTLTPAIETFGADKVKLLDPACGSGHFLIDGLKRLVAATAGQHPEWARDKVVLHALDRVVGVDLNDYACALARTRLVMTAAEVAGVSSLGDAARFHPRVYWSDALEQVEQVDPSRMAQLNFFATTIERTRATLTRPEVRSALQTEFKTKFHAVVVNPPYAEERDKRKKEYHREQLGRRRRYESAHKDYGLGPLFVERCVQLAAADAFLGVITANNFMKGESGQPFVEKVLAALDLTMIVDTSGAILAHSGFETPTVMLFARRRPPEASTVRVIIGKRGDTDRPSDLSKSAVWTSILAGWNRSGFDDSVVETVDLSRKKLREHPWAFHVGPTEALLSTIERRAEGRLRSKTEPIGFASFAGLYEAFYQPPGTFQRLGFPDSLVRPLLAGSDVREWCLTPREDALTPYGDDAEPLTFEGDLARPLHLWRFRTALKSVSSFSGDRESEGADWWCWYRWISSRYRLPLRITFADVVTHNQFAMDRGGHVFNTTTPIIRLTGAQTAERYCAVLGQLNSSTACFWLRNNAKKVGGRSTGTKRQSEPWAQRLRFTGGLVERLPIIDAQGARVASLATRLEACALELSSNMPEQVLNSDWAPQHLKTALARAEARAADVRHQMIAYQEELDWTLYAAFGLVSEQEIVPLDEIEPLASEHRPFAIRMGRSLERGLATRFWFDAMGVPPCVSVPAQYSTATQARILRRLQMIDVNHEIALIELPEYKRKWEPVPIRERLNEAMFLWLANRIEECARSRTKGMSASQLIGAMQGDERFLTVASIYQSRSDVDVSGLVLEIVADQAVPSHPTHLYSASGVAKRAVWEDVWALQRRQDAGEVIQKFPELPEFSQGSRGKSVDYLCNEYWRLRGKADVPRERFIAFTEVPGRSGVETLYGWAGWTPLQRLKAILAIDEDLEDAGTPLADRIGLLDSAWRLLPDVAREDAPAATRLKAELQALVGPDGPSRELIDAWKKRFPPPTAKTTRSRRAATVRVEDDGDTEESAES